MTPKQAEARRRNFFSNKTYRYTTDEKRKKAGMFFHARGYHLGDIRCCLCDKWINPLDPIESDEIQYGLGNHKTHKEEYCTTRTAFGPASFITYAKDGPARLKRNLGLVRY